MPCRNHTSEALGYDTRSQGISQFYLHSPRTSANGIHTAFAFPAEAGTQRDGRLSWLGVAGWLHAEISVLHRELNPDTVAHLSSTNRARRRLTSLIEANALTTTPDHQTCIFTHKLIVHKRQKLE